MAGWSKEEGRQHNDYLDWKVVERSKPVNFGQYIGNVKDQDPGATKAEDVLSKAHSKIKRKITTEITDQRKKENEELANFLTSIYFPKEGDNTVIASQFLKLVTSGYEKAFNDKIDKSNFGFDKDIIRPGVTKAEAKRIANEVKTSVSTKGKDEEGRGNAAFSTLGQQLKDLENLYNSFGNNNKLKGNFNAVKEDFKEKIKGVYSAYDAIIEFYEKGTEGQDWEKIKSKRLIEKGRIIDYNTIGKYDGAITGGKDGNLADTLKEFDTFYQTVMKMFCVPQTVYGNLFEYSLALLNFYTVPTDEEIENLTEEQIAKAVFKGANYSKVNNKIVGKNLISRGGNKHILNYDIDFLIESELTENKDKEFIVFNRESKKDQIKFGNFYVDISTQGMTVDSGEAKQGKCDVTLTIPSIASGREFRISAKNWSQIDDVHGLGNTSILRALDRTASVVDTSGKQEVLLNYIYAMQQPIEGEVDVYGRPIGRRPVADSAVSWGHKVARDSLILDIAMGFSQKNKQGNGQADILIILDRSRKRVIVIDIIDEIKKYLNDTGDINNLIIEGYNGEDIASAARSIRKLVREGVSYKKRDDNYVNLMKAYLNTKKAEIKLNQSYYSH